MANLPASDIFRKDDKIVPNDVYVVSNNQTYKHLTHLVTPCEIFSKTALSSDNTHTSKGMNVQDVVTRSDTENFEEDVNVIGEMGSNQESMQCERDRDSHTNVAEKKEKLFYYQASDVGIQMDKETYNIEAVCQADIFAPDQSCNSLEEEVQDTSKDLPANISESETMATVVQSPAPSVKGKRQKGKTSHVLVHIPLLLILLTQQIHQMIKVEIQEDHPWKLSYHSFLLSAGDDGLVVKHA